MPLPLPSPLPTPLFHHMPQSLPAPSSQCQGVTATCSGLSALDSATCSVSSAFSKPPCHQSLPLPNLPLPLAASLCHHLPQPLPAPSSQCQGVSATCSGLSALDSATCSVSSAFSK